MQTSKTKINFLVLFLVTGVSLVLLLAIYVVRVRHAFKVEHHHQRVAKCPEISRRRENSMKFDWLAKLEADYRNDSVLIYRSASLLVNGTLFIDDKFFFFNDTCRLVKGRRVIATYGSHGEYIDKSKRACQKAVATPGIDVCLVFMPKFLDDDFKRQNAKILQQGRGAGYWLWKSYVIWRLLLMIDADDVLFYMDADRILISNIEQYICVQASVKQDVVVFPTYWWRVPDYSYTKADALMIMNVEKVPRIGDSTQIYGCYLLFRKSLFSIRFVAEWMVYCQDDRVNTDEPNRFRTNPKNFVNTLHDQSTLSLLSKKWNIPSWPNPELDWNHGQNEKDKFGVVFGSFNQFPTSGNFTPPTRPIIGRH